MIAASISFAGGSWWWVSLIAAAALAPLAWLALRPGSLAPGAQAVALGLRALAIALLLAAILDPQWVEPRPKKGANLFAIIADNSQGLQIADSGSTVSRGGQLRGTLIDPANEWLPTLGENFQIRPYVFDRDLRRVKDFTELDFEGERSALGATLRSARERFKGQPVAGALLFTDGIATDLPRGLGDTSGLPPIYPVVVGNPEGLRDVRLDRTEIRQTAFDDAPVSLKAEISGADAANHDLDVSLKLLAAATPLPATAPPLPGNQTLRLRPDGQPAQVVFDWRPAGTGVQFYQVSVQPKLTPGLQLLEEATQLNNRSTVLVDRGRAAYRILYVSGRPTWEFKFLNRALAEDPQLQLPALIRLAKREPKFAFLGRPGESSNPLFRGFGGDADEQQRYDQPVIERVNVRDQNELRDGFPRTAEQLYEYDAVILDKVEASFFSADQLLLLRRFVSERGGGFLMVGGADSLDNGGYLETPLAGALPVYLDRKAAALPMGDFAWKLTREGWLEPWTRVRALENDERERLAAAPRLKTAHALFGIKPGATVLATVEDGAGRSFPALVSQRFGAGRVAVLAVANMWQGRLGSEPQMHDLGRYWRQIARWLVTDVPAMVELKTEPSGDAAGGVTFRVTVRDEEYRPLDLATVRVTVKRLGEAAPAQPGAPSGEATTPASGFQQTVLTAEPVADKPGLYTATLAPRDAGAYLAEAEALDRGGRVLGKAQAGWVNDPAAEEFRSLAPNRALLEELARRTGGRVVEWDELKALPAELDRAPAPITETKTWPLWHQGWVFLAVLGCLAAEWGWRRWKGLP